jgi:hypothetical protein
VRIEERLVSAASGLWAIDARNSANIVPGLPAGHWPFLLSRPPSRTVRFSSPAIRNCEFSAWARRPRQRQSRRLLLDRGLSPDLLLSFSGPSWRLTVRCFHLRTRLGMERGDITEAERAYNTAHLSPCKAVAVYGRRETAGAIQADSIDCAPDSPVLWGQTNDGPREALET